MRNVHLDNGCEALSDTSTILDLWRLHPSSAIPPKTIDELLEVHNTFSRIERAYLSSLERLNEFPNHLTENEYKVLYELEIRSSSDLSTVWNYVTRIATVSMLASIVGAIPTRDPLQLIAHAKRYVQAIMPLQVQLIEDPQLSELAHHHAIIKHRVLTELSTVLQADAAITRIGSPDELDVRVTSIANSVIGLINHEIVAYIADRAVVVLAKPE